MTNAVSVAQYGGVGATKNRIINGAMVIDQRNNGAAVTISVDNTYVTDRFAGNRGGSINNYTIQQSSTVPSGATFTKSLLTTMGTGVTVGASDYAMLGYKIEGFNVADFGLGTANASSFTLSFWVRSSVTGTFGASFRNNAATATYCSTYTIISANTWEYKTVTIPAITSGTWTTDNTTGIYVTWDLGVGSTYSGTANQLNTGSNYFGVLGTTKLAATTGATFYITGVQLEAGTTASPFEYRQYGTELALCQRYYRQTATTATAYGEGTLYGYNTSTTSVGYTIAFPVQMRASPTLTVGGTWGATNSSGINLSGGTPNSYFIYGAPTSTGAFNITSGSTGYLYFNAEL